MTIGKRPLILFTLVLVFAGWVGVLEYQETLAANTKADSSTSANKETVAAKSIPKIGTNWRKKLGVFRVGIVGGSRTILETRQVQPFKNALQDSLGMPVEIFAARDHAALIEAIVGSRIEYAVFSATAFSATWKMCKCVEPIAVPTTADGSSGFRSVLITRKKAKRKSAVNRLSDLKGSTTVVPGKHSFSGYLYPKIELGRSGITLDTKNWPVENMETMDAAIQGFHEGKGDALLGWMPALANNESARGTLAALIEKAGGDKTAFRTIWTSPALPHGPHAVRNNLANEAKVIVWNTLRDLNQKGPKAYDAIEPLFGNGFQQATLEDYRPLINILKISSSLEELSSKLDD